MRRTLGLGENDRVVVSSFTCNAVCRSFSLDSMFAAVGRHEAFGSRDSLDPSVANRHEARRQVAARDPVNDPYLILESFVHASHRDLREVVRWSVWEADQRISAFADPTLHTYVRDNYIVGGQGCGEAWVFDETAHAYQKIRLDQNGPCP